MTSAALIARPSQIAGRVTGPARQPCKSKTRHQLTEPSTFAPRLVHLRMDELPPPDVIRWTPRRKNAVVMAVRSGAISRAEACARYHLSEEELLAWERAFDQHGLPGLRATTFQYYRSVGREPRG